MDGVFHISVSCLLAGHGVIVLSGCMERCDEFWGLCRVIWVTSIWRFDKFKCWYVVGRWNG
jgi:hypothetical protein